MARISTPYRKCNQSYLDLAERLIDGTHPVLMATFTHGMDIYGEVTYCLDLYYSDEKDATKRFPLALPNQPKQLGTKRANALFSIVEDITKMSIEGFTAGAFQYLP